ncbi:MAG: GTP-sensing pleiotropic transcriptional regulator CodY [Clostridiales bacterium]|jgi:transcriptional pleiotropic repressor|nr:GTP-sensing pleiotropic transcriptional regulator CodY [Clostridiales bacterium]
MRSDQLVSQELLENTRELNKILQSSGPDGVVFSDLTNALSRILNCNVFVVSRKGRILSKTIANENSTLPFVEVKKKEFRFDEQFNNKLLTHNETRVNISTNEDKQVYVTVIPVQSGVGRLGTLIFECFGREMTTEDMILAEYSATVVGMEIMRSKTEEIEEQARKKAVVQMAIGTLSYSELEAVEHIFNELDGSEGLLVASKIADRVGITRSVIVNALRKFESAGVIESRSLGMKGTHIKILNDELLPELAKMK